jgi:2,3-bisphosphoglycerate-dependent phosphoglycerate mutase
MEPTRFLLIRHAESPWSEDDARPLSAAGRRAAEALPERLEGFAIDAIYSSPHRRALETAAPLAERRGLPIAELADLRERTLGAPPSGGFAEGMAAGWADFDLVHPGGESSRSAQRRVLGVVSALAGRHPSRTIALATHGNLLALLLHAFDPRVGLAFWRSLEFPDVFELCLEPSGAGTFRRIGRRPVPAYGAVAHDHSRRE